MTKEYIAKKAATDVIEWVCNPGLVKDSDYVTHRIMQAIDEYGRGGVTKDSKPKKRVWTGATLADAILKDHVYARQTFLKYAFHYKSPSHLKVLSEFCELIQNEDIIAIKAWFKLTKRQKERIAECVPEYFIEGCLIIH